MAIIRARQPALTRVIQINRNGPTVIVPNRAAYGSAIVTFPYILNERFNEPNVTVFSDDFNRTDPAPWVPRNNATVTVVSGELNVESDGATQGVAEYPAADYGDSKWLKISVDFIQDGTTPGRIEARTGGGVLIQDTENLTASGTYSLTVQQPVGETVSVWLRTVAVSGRSKWDNVLIQEVPALDGWDDNSSGSQYPEIVNGQLSLERTDASNIASVDSADAITVQGNSLISVDGAAGSPNCVLNLGSTQGGSDLGQKTILVGSNQFSLTHTGNLFLRIFPDATGTALLDNITVQETLVTNGTFDSDVAGWISLGPGTISSVNGECELNATDAFAQVRNQAAIPTEIGQRYRVQATTRDGTRNMILFADPDTIAAGQYYQSTETGLQDFTFTATSTTLYIHGQGAGGAGTSYLDDVIVQPVRNI